MGSRLDHVYRSIAITKFFTKGWGKPENLRRLFEFRKVVSNRDRCFKLIERDYPVTITKEEKTAEYRILEGQFATPLERFLPGIVPPAAQTAHFQMVLPLQWREPSYRPVCLHLAGTGDHFYWRRRNLMVKPLLKEACIGGIILENPFYGLRKPADQVRSSLHNVSDIFVMGGCLILESLVLFHFCERNQLGPLGVTGLSMGGHMASLAATNWPKPMVLVPCLSWSTASAVFLQGVMSQSINWDLLEDQYLADGEYSKSLSKMVTVVDEAFLAGKKFARRFQQKVDQCPHEKKIIADKFCHTEQDDGLCSERTKDTLGDSANDIKHFSGDMLAYDLLLDKCDKSLVFVGNLRDKQELYEELTKLLNNRKISMGLFKKLTSNQRFSLSKAEIDELNQINKEYVIRQIATKYKLDMTNAELALKLGLPPNSDGRAEGAQASPGIASPSLPSSRSLCTPVPPTTGPDETKSKNITEMTTDYFLRFPFIKNLLDDPKSGTDKTVAKQESASEVCLGEPVGKGGRPRLDISKVHWRDRETLQFMRGIMDEFTHLSNFSVPYDTSLIIAVCAKHDAYVPREDVGALEEIWPGAEVRYVEAGHVSAYLLHQGLFRSSIAESFERSKKKWKNEKHIS